MTSPESELYRKHLKEMCCTGAVASCTPKLQASESETLQHCNTPSLKVKTVIAMLSTIQLNLSNA